MFNKIIWVIFALVIVIPLTAAETIEAYVPFATIVEAQQLISGLPDMTTSQDARLSRMNYFLSSSNSIGELRNNPPYTKGNRTRAFQLSHPVKSFNSSASDVTWATENVLNHFTVEEFAALVPLQNPNISTPNPRTKIANWIWDPLNPDTLTDSVTGEKFPNGDFLEVDTGYGLTSFGEVVAIPFWYDSSYATTPYDVFSSPTAKADIGTFNGRYYFTGAIDRQKHSYMETTLKILGQAYDFSGDEKFAEYVRAALKVYASRYRFVLGSRETKTDKMGSYVYNPLLDHIGSSMLLIQRYYRDTGYNVYLNQVNEFTAIYDLIYRSDILNETVPGEQISYRDYIEELLFTPAIDMAWDTRPTTGEAIGNIADYAFMTMELTHVMGKDDWASMVQEYITLNMTQGNGASDGLSMEGPGYHTNTMGNIKYATKLMSYYQNGEEFFDYRFSQNYMNAMTNTSVFRYPNGLLAPVHDNGNAYIKPSSVYQVGPIPRMVNRIAPGFGHTLLGDGENENEIHSFLHWSGGGSHSHRDNLTIGLFCNGREIYGDPGYNWDDYARSMYGHNTVLVNGLDANSVVGNIGDNNFFSPNTPGMSINRVDHSSSYRTKINSFERFRRTLGLNTTDPTKPYLIDVFEVSGGEQHEYFLEGSMVTGMSMSVSLASGSSTWSAKPEYLNPVSNMKIGTVSPDDYFTMFYDDDPTTGVKVHIVTLPGDSLSLAYGDGPYFNKVDNGQYNGPVVGKSVPKIVLRRSGDSADTLRTVFVTIHEPFKNGVTNIASVSKELIKDNGKPVQLGVTVTFNDGREDYHLFSLKGEKLVNIDDQQPMTYGPLTVNGSYGGAITSGSNCDLYMVSGTSASCKSKTLSAPAAFKTGTLLGIVRENESDKHSYIVSDIDLPLGTELDREMIYVDFLDGDGNIKFINSLEIKEVLGDPSGVKIEVYENAAIDLVSGVYTEKMPAQGDRTGTTVRLRYATAKTTVPIAKIYPDQGLWERDRASWNLPVYKDSITVSTLANNGDVKYKIDSGNYSSLHSSHSIAPTAISDTTTTISATAINSGGVMVSPVVVQKYRNILASVTPGTVEAGLLCNLSNNGFLVTPDIRVPEVKYSNNDDYIFEGFITAPKEGVYQFRYMADEGVIKINNIEVANSFDFDQNIPWYFGTTLEKGVHPFSMSMRWNPEYKYSLRNIGDFVLQWKIPGDTAFTTVPASVYTHTPKSSQPTIVLDYEVDSTDSMSYRFWVSSSNDGSGNSINRDVIGWDVNGDGRTDFIGTDSLYHTFPDTGTYKFFIIGFSPEGERCIDSSSITIRNQVVGILSPSKKVVKNSSFFGPNPATFNTEITFVLPTSSEEYTITILDNIGNSIWSKSGSSIGASIVWDMRNRNGRLVSSGSYIAILETETSSGNRTVSTGIVGVRE